MTTNTLSTPNKKYYSYGRGHRLETWYFYLFQDYYRNFKNEKEWWKDEEYQLFREDFEKFLGSHQNKIKTLKLRRKIIYDMMKDGLEPYEEFELFKSQLER